MAALGVFGLLQIVAFTEMLRSHLSNKEVKDIFVAFLVSATLIMFAALVFLTMNGYIAPWSGRLYSLWDTAYAAKFIPIIASVSEVCNYLTLASTDSLAAFFQRFAIFDCCFPCWSIFLL